MFNKILIANRGEIALRIMRACRDLGIHSVLIYSEADADSLPVQLAEEKYCIGPTTPSQSYLNIYAIMNVAMLTGCDAIHPGYGFLSENAHFADICRQHKIKFIGASPENIRLMGDKATARETVNKLGIATVPGSDGLIHDIDKAKILIEKMGYPVLVKATAGGGGRGMRIIYSADEIENTIHAASQEALVAFGNGGVYIEKFITSMKHIEFQVFGDSLGNYVHLGERDCSVQRRHQKLLEESPSSALNEEMRKKMGETSIRIAQSIGYEGAGTIEYILDLKTDEFYFMEMNTRIQVEHPVTEIVTGRDLLIEQLSIAMGEKLSFSQEDIKMSGHAMEFRINCEDTLQNFRPCPGKINDYVVPGGIGVRVDSHCYAGYTVPPYYDSLLGKLIIYGTDRQQTINRAKRALSEFGISGIQTTIPLFLDILEDDVFTHGTVSTKYLDSFLQIYTENAKMKQDAN